MGKAEYAPCAPTRTARDALAIAAKTLGVNLRIGALPAWTLGASAVFSPLLRELIEMRFRQDRPCQVTRAVSPPAGYAVRNPHPRGRARLSRRIEAVALKLPRLR